MLDSASYSLLPIATSKRPRVIVLGFDENSLSELEQLLATLEMDIKAVLKTTLKRIVPATYIGSGKIEEISEKQKAEDADAVIIDIDLSPNQLKNLEKAIAKPVLDRAGVIIEIFSQHARTKEAKTQVELARLNYLLPRLTHFWNHFERQRGGTATRGGMGEKQLEVDRRLLKKRISLLTQRLDDIEKERNVQRQGRKDILKVALVGYTNAGKSTLLNQLTLSHVLAENKLFATLDSSVRALDPFSHPPIVAIDTVGFISNIPPGLIASFRSTLEELHEADLLLHVVDGSSPRAREQYLVTEEVLKDLKLEDKPRITVLNKADLLKNPATLNWARISVPGSMRVSAFKEEDVQKLRDEIQKFFVNKLESWEVMIPYSDSQVEARIHEYGNIEVKRYLEKGTFYKVRIDGSWAKKLGLEKYRT